MAATSASATATSASATAASGAGATTATAEAAIAHARIASVGNFARLCAVAHVESATAATAVHAKIAAATAAIRTKVTTSAIRSNVARTRARTTIRGEVAIAGTKLTAALASDATIRSTLKSSTVVQAGATQTAFASAKLFPRLCRLAVVVAVPLSSRAVAIRHALAVDGIVLPIVVLNVRAVEVVVAIDVDIHIAMAPIEAAP